MLARILKGLHRSSLLLGIASAAAGLAAEMGNVAQAATVPISIQGVIVQNISGICNTFEADDGNTYMLSSQGTFSAGDRVHVNGSYDDTMVSWCFNTGGPYINVSSILPAFAGIGTITSTAFGIRLVTDDGRTFILQNTGAFRAGTQVYVQGYVTTPSRTVAMINDNVIGPAYSGFGRITDIDPANIRFTSETGQVYSLDRFGSVPIYTLLLGDYVYVEGIRSRSLSGPIPLSSVTARPAFNASGRVVASGSGVAFDPDTMILAPQFTASALAGNAVGSKVYLRGRSVDDYDFGETKIANNIRLSRVGASYTAVGYLDTATKTMINLDDGTLVHLEYTGHPLFNPSGSIVYVAGPIAAEGSGSVTLSHNQTRVGIIAVGYVINGDTCTPIVYTAQGARLFPRNMGSFGFMDHVRIVGGGTFESPCIDEGGVVDNTIAFEPTDW